VPEAGASPEAVTFGNTQASLFRDWTDFRSVDAILILRRDLAEFETLRNESTTWQETTRVETEHARSLGLSLAVGLGFWITLATLASWKARLGQQR
jgi:hypothetical protein